jgi:hypothetical protein
VPAAVTNTLTLTRTPTGTPTSTATATATATTTGTATATATTTPVPLGSPCSSGFPCNLGQAGNFAVLGINGADFDISSPGTSITGNVGLGPNSTGSLIKAHINGTLFKDPTSSATIGSDLNQSHGGIYMVALLQEGVDDRSEGVSQ